MCRPYFAGDRKISTHDPLVTLYQDCSNYIQAYRNASTLFLFVQMLLYELVTDLLSLMVEQKAGKKSLI